MESTVTTGTVAGAGSSPAMPGHRRSLRIETDAVLDLAGPHEVLLDHAIANINLDGVALDAPALEVIGERVDLTIHFPDFGARIETGGEVVWARAKPTPQMGIRFDPLPDEARGVLERYLYARGQTS